MADEVQDIIMSFSTTLEWLSLRSVIKSMYSSYGCRLPKMILRRPTSSSTRTLALLMEKQQCLRELQITKSGTLGCVAGILSRGECGRRLKTIVLNAQVMQGELDALAAVIELEQIPSLQVMDLSETAKPPPLLLGGTGFTS